jgi:hypothetical protein
MNRFGRDDHCKILPAATPLVRMSWLARLGYVLVLQVRERRPRFMLP